MNEQVRKALEDADLSLLKAENAIDDARDALNILRELATENALEPGAPDPKAERTRLDEWNRISRPAVQA